MQGQVDLMLLATALVVIMSLGQIHKSGLWLGILRIGKYFVA